jgi:hypothetical protein
MIIKIIFISSRYYLSGMSYPPKNIRHGALHEELGIPEDKKIGKGNLERICHGTIGEQIMVHGHPVTIDRQIQERACFGLNFGYRKR